MDQTQSPASKSTRHRIRRIFASQLEHRDADAPPDVRSLFVPLHYEPSYAYPLLVWLHGPGESEGVLSEVMRRVSLRNYVAVAPRGTIARSVIAGNDGATKSGYGWSEDDEHLVWAEQRLFSAIEAAGRQVHIHRDRVFVAGCGEGGTMALRLALADPRRFAGAASLGGPFPQGGCPLGRLLEARQLAVFVAAGGGTADAQGERTDHDLQLLHAAGMNVSAWHLPGDDVLSPAMLAELNRWLMELVCSGRAAGDIGRPTASW